ncbi:purine and uridine phosphorylase [Aspergillus alliaceus]|uniref:purine and uridine phosphorylase n=1 Tax=Petromyces alliaceus TaxID=209559 RepID=UPI0012A618A1|nr:purine and uridine phosphorylase [Aspergillus alliaceus]KAB8234347.1 purine and uridine phosphorylase [Aspergillus alliaceus]
MRPKCRSDFAVAIICALPIEADAVEALFDETYDRLGKIYGKQPGDANAYINGRIGEHDIVLCYMPGMGIGSAASVASSLRVSYKGVRLALVVGICGGAPYASSDQNIFLGDVIVSDAVVEYDFGRQYPGGFQRKTDVKEILGRPDREIRTLLAGLKGKQTRIEFQDQMSQHLCIIQQSDTRWQHPRCEDILYKASYHHKHYSQGSTVNCCCFDGGNPENICSEALDESCKKLGCDEKQVSRRRDGAEAVKASLHIGKVASANRVMKSGDHRDNIIKAERVIGFEMEGAGVWDNISCIIIKGVCDYADSHKSKTWQAYAAATGASAAKTFLEYWSPTHREERKRHWIVPFRKNPQFVGRHDEIVKLEEWITQQNGPSKVAVCGLGGVGKTQVALELAYRIRERDSECSIFWVPCFSYESVEQAYMNIAQTLGIEDMKPAEAKDRVKAYLSHKDAGKWLLIFDNADDIEMWMQGSNTNPALKDFPPQNEQGHIIFTTRNRKLAVKLVSSYVISIPDQDQDTAMKILEKSLPENYFLGQNDAAAILLEHLAFLPLAITQAAAYINENTMQLKDYIDLLQEQEASVVELLSKEFEDEGRYKDIQNPVATTWWISFQQIQHLDTLASDYLSLMACINPRDIPQSFLPQPASKLKMYDAVGLLKAYSFVSEQAGEGLLSLHRLVYLATRNWMRTKNQFTQKILKATDRLNEIFPDSSHSNRKLWQQYLPHALLVLGESEIHEQQEKYVDLRQNVGACLYSDGRYNDAEELQVQVMETQKQVLGPEHPDTLTSMANLASTYWDQGRWKEAEELEVQVIETCKQVLGPEHPNTLISIANLASTYRNQGQWKEAEELDMQVMETRKQVLGPEHPHTLTSMANLTLTYWDQGRWKEAEELQVQAMETRKQVLGLEHPNTLISIANLASTYRNQGRWKEAEELDMQVMETRKQEAEELDMQVMETRKQVLGPEHPHTLTSMANLALTYWDQGRWKEAEELQVQAMETQKKILGPEHPDILTSMHNLAFTWESLGKLSDALMLMEKCVELHTKLFGPDHPYTLSSSKALSEWLQAKDSAPAKLPLIANATHDT